jgi:hypothetical protein
MSEKLKDFLIRVGEDYDLASQFNRIGEVLDQSGLSAEEQAAFLSRDPEQVRRLLGDDKNLIFMILQWFHDRPRA